MPTFTIMTTREERDHLYDVLRRFHDKETPVATIATAAGMTPTRVRYVIDDLVAEGRLDKVPTRSINARYMRYKYLVKDVIPYVQT